MNAVDIREDADNVRYDPAEKRVYVAYGGDEEGGIAVIDAATGKRLEDVAKGRAPRIVCYVKTGHLRQYRYQSEGCGNRSRDAQSH